MHDNSPLRLSSEVGAHGPGVRTQGALLPDPGLHLSSCTWTHAVDDGSDSRTQKVSKPERTSGTSFGSLFFFLREPECREITGLA